MTGCRIRSHFGSRAISCSNVHGVFPVHERFWFCFEQVSTTQFCCFPPVPMARASDGTDVPVSPLPASSSKMGSLNGSFLDLEGTGYRASTMEKKINDMFVQIAKLPLLMQRKSRFENCVQTLSHTVASYDAKSTNIEQKVGSLAARVTTLETNATTVSSGSGSARSWNMLGQSTGSTASGFLLSHGPRSSDDNRNTRRRLDPSSSPADEHARSAVLLRFPCEQYHKGITKWINDLWEESNMPAHSRPVTIHCKAGSMSVRLVFESRAKFQDFVVRYKEDGIPYEIDGPFCSVKTTITVRQSKSIQDREIGKQFAPLWRELADQLQILFPCRDDEGAFIIPALDTRSHVLSIKDGRNGIGKPVFNHAALGSGQTFTHVSPELSVPGVPPDVATCSLSSQLGQCVMAALLPHRFFAAWRVEAPFSAVSLPFRWVLHFVLYLTRSVVLHDSPSCSREDSLDQRERPRYTLFCFLFSAPWLRCYYSLLVQETQSGKDLDLTCFTTFPFNAVTCLPVGPVSSDWPIDPLARSDLSRSSLPSEVPSGEQELGAPASTRSRWRQDALQAQPQIIQRTEGWDGCGPFLSEGVRRITWNTRVLLDLFSPEGNGEYKLKYPKRPFDANNITCLQ